MARRLSLSLESSLAARKFYAFKAKSDAIRAHSSSGGAFTLIAKRVLSAGGVVFGAGFDENLNVLHRFIEREGDIELLQRSKYVESRIGDAFKQARDFLKRGRIVLFSGVQCQIHGLNSFLARKFDNLITLEVICNSVPSSRVWEIYRESLSLELGESLQSFNFRSKDLGWENGAVFVATSRTQNKSLEATQSPYYEAFLNHTITRESCANCYSKAFQSGADITLGDFWGIRNFHAEFLEADNSQQKGISCVIAHNKKAISLIESLENCEILETTFAAIASGNPALIRANPIHPRRDFVMREIFKIYENAGATHAMAFLERENRAIRPSNLASENRAIRPSKIARILRKILARILPKRLKTYLKSKLKGQK